MIEILGIAGVAVAAVFIAVLLRLSHERKDARRRNQPPPMVDFTPRKSRGRIDDKDRPTNLKGW